MIAKLFHKEFYQKTTDDHESPCQLQNDTIDENKILTILSLNLKQEQLIEENACAYFRSLHTVCPD